MRGAWPIVLSAAALLGAASASAQREEGEEGRGNRWLRQVQNGLARAQRSLTRTGFERIPADHAGLLDTGESGSFTLTLEPAAQYAVLGVCDGDCAALSILLYNDSDYEVAADRASGAAAVVQVRPQTDTRFRVKIVMAECRLNPCWYGVAVYRQTAEAGPGTKRGSGPVAARGEDRRHLEVRGEMGRPTLPGLTS
ncbi:MAG: hypothetical protein ACREL9_05730 [Gemmatimonadales bacterium]